MDKAGGYACAVDSTDGRFVQSVQDMLTVNTLMKIPGMEEDGVCVCVCVCVCVRIHTHTQCYKGVIPCLLSVMKVSGEICMCITTGCVCEYSE